MTKRFPNWKMLKLQKIKKPEISFEEKFSEKLYIQKEELCFQSKEREIEALIHFLQKLVKKSLGKNEKMKRKIHNSLQKEELEKKFL